MSGNVNQRAKARRAGAKAWMVGEPISGVGNYIFGRGNHKNNVNNNELLARTPLGKDRKRNNVTVNPCTNQLGGVGRYKSQFSVTADSINVNSPFVDCNK